MESLTDLPPIASHQNDTGPAHKHTADVICLPVKTDSRIRVSEYPPLPSLCCTSCGARGDGPLEYHKSNANKWGSSFVWIYCMRCMAAFGNIMRNELRTYKSSPKQGSPTALLRSQQPGNGLSNKVPLHGVVKSFQPRGGLSLQPGNGAEPTKAAEGQQSDIFTFPSTSAGALRPAPRRQLSMSDSPAKFMEMKFPTSSPIGSSPDNRPGDLSSEFDLVLTQPNFKGRKALL
ncbi:hypothetical protein BKA62DRAFT_679712 [Auriculariales sp. MPI-PUGE-AT-0066]|nr:hypothetical protein BKA62DRAFT_679712 [Auriculariales sp. MPI-PUGE-AT-0066]